MVRSRSRGRNTNGDATAEATDTGSPRAGPQAPTAIVVGAGIAGLTAAHELACRGFKVTVVERVREQRGNAGGPAVGGLARSQFAWFLRTQEAETEYAKEAELRNWGSCSDPVKNMTTDEVPADVPSEPPVEPPPSNPQRLGQPGSVLRSVWDNQETENPRGSGFVQARHGMPLAKLAVAWSARPNPSDPNNGMSVHVHVEAAWPADTGRRLVSAGRYMGWLAPGRAWDPRLFRMRIVLGPGFPATPVRAEVLKQIEPQVREILRLRVKDITDQNKDLSFEALLNYYRNVPLQLVEMPKQVWDLDHLSDKGMGYIEIVFDDDVGDCRGHVQECAGEHGYRFFPSFYAHLFDTMKRTPLLDPDDLSAGVGEYEVHRTAYDNLVSLTHFLFGRDDGKPPEMMNKSVRASLTSMFRTERLLLSRLGFETRDLVRAQVKQLQYLTSCRARRDVTASITWGQYMGLGDGGYSPAFEEAMRKWPQALVGLQADRADARTFGDITMQQLLDPIRSGEKTDATLNGPTSTAWLDPWRRYLERVYCVTFQCGEAEQLYVNRATDGSPSGIRVHFTDGLEYEHATVDSKFWLPYKLGSFGEPVIGENGRLPEGAYLVLAVAPNEAYRLLRTLEASVALSVPPTPSNPPTDTDRSWAAFVRSRTASEHDGWISRTFRVLDTPTKKYRPADVQTEAYVEGSALQNFVGLQYFFIDRDIPFVRGHLFLPDHPFAISAISQQQFRVARGSARWVAGTLSLDLGDPTGKAQTVATEMLWKLSRDQIAQEVWHHLGKCFQVPMDPTDTTLGASDGVLYHIDEGYYFGSVDVAQYPWMDPAAAGQVFYGTPWFVKSNIEEGFGSIDSGEAGIGYNNTPYLVVRPGAFQHWPGTIDPDRPQRGYDIEFGNFVCCGTHCRTFTRLGTMESANESARHAVNGILRDFDRGEGGWNPRADGDGTELGVTTMLLEARSAGDTGGATVESAYVPVWTLEEREPEDLGLLKTIDAALHKEGMPHLFDVLKLDSLIRTSLPTGNHRPDEPNLVDDLLRLVEGGRLDLRHLARWASPFTLAMLGTLLKMPGARR